MFGILTKAKNYIYGKRRIRNALSFTKAIVQEDSYFPEHTRKTEKQRLQENKLWAKKYEEPNKFYNLYGFDLVNSNLGDSKLIGLSSLLSLLRILFMVLLRVNIHIIA